MGLDQSLDFIPKTNGGNAALRWEAWIVSLDPRHSEEQYHAVECHQTPETLGCEICTETYVKLDQNVVITLRPCHNPPLLLKFCRPNSQTSAVPPPAHPPYVLICFSVFLRYFSCHCHARCFAGTVTIVRAMGISDCIVVDSRTVQLRVGSGQYSSYVLYRRYRSVP